MCLTDPSCDPRPRRAAELFASAGLDVSVLGYPSNQTFPGYLYYHLPYPSGGLLRKFWRMLWGVLTALMPFEICRVYCEKQRFGLTRIKDTFDEVPFDLLVVEDIQLLPLAFEIKGEGKVLFDAREYYPRQNEGEFWFELFEKKRRVQLCQDYMTRCDAVVTVSEGLRREYLKEFGVVSEVYRSTPSYVELYARPVNPDKIRMVYHGAANRNRRIEKLIEMISLLDERFSLDMILIGNLRYQNELRRKAASVNNVTFLEPVPLEKIITTIGQYDIGLCYFEPTTFNLKNCLPNKFFEYIQARLMIALGPTPDMVKLVKEFGCGVVAESFSITAMANSLNSLTAASIDKGKQRSDRAARELCFEKEREKMVALLDRLLDQQVEKRGD